MYFVLKFLKFYLHSFRSTCFGHHCVHPDDGHNGVRNMYSGINVYKILKILKQSTSGWRFYSSYYNDVRNHEPGTIQNYFFQSF